MSEGSDAERELCERLAREYEENPVDILRLVRVCEGHEVLCRKTLDYGRQRGMPMTGMVWLAQVLKQRAGAS